MRTRNILILTAASTTLLALTANAQTSVGVANSPHDFSQMTWNTRKGVCSTCHAAHNTDPKQIVPLWAHATSGAQFVPYTSPSINFTPGMPDGTSLACLSCHDGTVAINQGINGQIGTPAQFIDPGAQVGPDLHTTHPISFDYTPTMAIADGGLENPDTYKIGDPKSVITVNNPPVPASGWSGTSLSGKSIKQAMLTGPSGYRMQCSSCHDVHKLVGSAPSSGILAKISGTDAQNRGSLLCRTCHIK
jgi:hypothetical protein